MKTKKTAESKEIKRTKIIEYLSDPDNPPLTRQEIALKVLGYAHVESMYNAFSVHELCEMEKEALDIRRQRYANALSHVDKALITQAMKGDPQAIKLMYQRFESWTEKTQVDQTTRVLVEIDGE